MAESFESLKAKMADWIGADALRLPEAVRGDCINLIQRQVMRNHDLRFGETADTLALISGDRDYPLPSTWRNPLSLWYTNPSTSARIDLVRLSKDEFDARFPSAADTGTPSHYTVWGLILYIGPTPNQNLTLNRNYYQYLPDLINGAPNNTNSFVNEAWDVLFFGALEHASRYLLEDPRAPMWAERFRELEGDLAGEHQRERSSGRVPQSREPG
jgi:hypothetical protein